MVLVGLIYYYMRLPVWQAALSGGIFAVLCTWLLSSCPVEVLAALQASSILVMALGSRLPQIILNIRRGNAGMLSATTCLLNVAGNSARIFTTLVLTGDMLLLQGVVTQGCLNAVLLYQSVRSELRSGRAEAGQQSGVPAPQMA
eukprot:jgi/Chrzof1/15140/Cz09g28190.t1